MSLGTGYHDSYCDQSSALTEIIERLKSKGIATVVAAGNNDYYDGLSEPACISSTISVAALDKRDALDISYTNVSKLIHIAAPGTDIVSTVPGNQYETLSGTSMAAPHVAAAIALLRQHFPNETVTQLERRLVANAPSAVDPRTNTSLPILELTHALDTSPQSSTTSVIPAASTDTPSSIPPAESDNTFIIKSPAQQGNIEQTLGQNCEGIECDLKPIGKDTYKLDIKPSAGAKGLSKDQIENIIKPLGSGSAVFKNGLSVPFKF